MDLALALHRFGLVPSDDSLPEIRDLLAQEADAERRGMERIDDLALLCCVQLFARGYLQDILRIWEVKSSGWDLFHYLDVQFLCGSGLEETKQFLSEHPSQDAAKALKYLGECEASGDFDEFSPTEHLEHYRKYFAPR
jgi:hypothetical protein